MKVRATQLNLLTPFASALVSLVLRCAAFAQTPPDQAPAPVPAPAPTLNAPPPAAAQPQKTLWVAHLLRRKSKANLIDGLEFTDTNLPVYLLAKQDDLRPTIVVDGTFHRPGWTLMAQNDEVKLDPETNKFEVDMHLRGRVNECVFTAVGPKGQKEREAVYIYAPEAMEFHVVSVWDHILLSAGPAFFSYDQTGYGKFESIVAQLAVRYTSPENSKALGNFGFYGSLDASVFTLASSPVTRGPQLIEGKGDVTYLLHGATAEKYHLQALAGLSYLTMFSNGSSFGFANLIAPEIGLRGRKPIDANSAYVGEVRYMPIGLPNSITQLGLNINVGWTRLIQNTRRVEYGLTYSGYFYEPGTNQTIRLHQFGIRAGLSF